MTITNLNQFNQTTARGLLEQAPNANIFSCQINPSSTTPITAGDAVKLVDNTSKVISIDKAGEGDAIFGYMALQRKNNSPKAGDIVEIASDYAVMMMEASATIARGSKVKYDTTTGQVASAETSDTSCGIAFDKATTASDLIRVLIKVL